MARRLRVSSRKKRTASADEKTPRKLSRTTLMAIAAIVVFGLAVYLYLPQSAPPHRVATTTAPAPVIGQNAPTVAVKVTPAANPEPVNASAPDEEKEPNGAVFPSETAKEAPLPNTELERAFKIPVDRAAMPKDPLALYMRLTRAPARRVAARPTRPSVPLPTFEEPPQPWIETWVANEQVRYVAYVAGKRPGAVVATKDGEVVVFGGQFPGAPRVRIARITPKSIVLTALGHNTEVKK